MFGRLHRRRSNLQDLGRLSKSCPVVDSPVRSDSDSSFGSVSTASTGAGRDADSSDDASPTVSPAEQRLARKSVRRARQREVQHLRNMEENKISMDDYLGKQEQFRMWLFEEQKKEDKVLSSPKRKTYFKMFVRLWNKRHLPSKYYENRTDKHMNETLVQGVPVESVPQTPSPLSARPPFFALMQDSPLLDPSIFPHCIDLSMDSIKATPSPFSTFGKAEPSSDFTPTFSHGRDAVLRRKNLARKRSLSVSDKENATKYSKPVTESAAAGQTASITPHFKMTALCEGTTGHMMLTRTRNSRSDLKVTPVDSPQCPKDLMSGKPQQDVCASVSQQLYHQATDAFSPQYAELLFADDSPATYVVPGSKSLAGSQSSRLNHRRSRSISDIPTYAVPNKAAREERSVENEEALEAGDNFSPSPPPVPPKLFSLREEGLGFQDVDPFVHAATVNSTNSFMHKRVNPQNAADDCSTVRKPEEAGPSDYQSETALKKTSKKFTKPRLPWLKKLSSRRRSRSCEELSPRIPSTASVEENMSDFPLLQLDKSPTLGRRGFQRPRRPACTETNRSKHNMLPLGQNSGTPIKTASGLTPLSMRPMVLSTEPVAVCARELCVSSPNIDKLRQSVRRRSRSMEQISSPNKEMFYYESGLSSFKPSQPETHEQSHSLHGKASSLPLSAHKAAGTVYQQPASHNGHLGQAESVKLSGPPSKSHDRIEEPMEVDELDSSPKRRGQVSSQSILLKRSSHVHSKETETQQSHVASVSHSFSLAVDPLEHQATVNSTSGSIHKEANSVSTTEQAPPLAVHHQPVSSGRRLPAVPKSTVSFDKQHSPQSDSSSSAAFNSLPTPEKQPSPQAHGSARGSTLAHHLPKKSAYAILFPDSLPFSQGGQQSAHSPKKSAYATFFPKVQLSLQDNDRAAGGASTLTCSKAQSQGTSKVLTTAKSPHSASVNESQSHSEAVYLDHAPIACLFPSQTVDKEGRQPLDSKTHDKSVSKMGTPVLLEQFTSSPCRPGKAKSDAVPHSIEMACPIVSGDHAAKKALLETALSKAMLISVPNKPISESVSSKSGTEVHTERLASSVSSSVASVAAFALPTTESPKFLKPTLSVPTPQVIPGIVPATAVPERLRPSSTTKSHRRRSRSLDGSPLNHFVVKSTAFISLSQHSSPDVPLPLHHDVHTIHRGVSQWTESLSREPATVEMVKSVSPVLATLWQPFNNTWVTNNDNTLQGQTCKVAKMMTSTGEASKTSTITSSCLQPPVMSAQCTGGLKDEAPSAVISQKAPLSQLERVNMEKVMNAASVSTVQAQSTPTTASHNDNSLVRHLAAKITRQSSRRRSRSVGDVASLQDNSPALEEGASFNSRKAFFDRPQAGGSPGLQRNFSINRRPRERMLRDKPTTVSQETQHQGKAPESSDVASKPGVHDSQHLGCLPESTTHSVHIELRKVTSVDSQRPHPSPIGNVNAQPIKLSPFITVRRNSSLKSRNGQLGSPSSTDHQTTQPGVNEYTTGTQHTLSRTTAHSPSPSYLTFETGTAQSTEVQPFSSEIGAKRQLPSITPIKDETQPAALNDKSVDTVKNTDHSSELSLSEVSPAKEKKPAPPPPPKPLPKPKKNPITEMQQSLSPSSSEQSKHSESSDSLTSTYTKRSNTVQKRGSQELFKVDVPEKVVQEKVTAGGTACANPSSVSTNPLAHAITSTGSSGGGNVGGSPSMQAKSSGGKHETNNSSVTKEESCLGKDSEGLAAVTRKPSVRQMAKLFTAVRRQSSGRKGANSPSVSRQNSTRRSSGKVSTPVARRSSGKVSTPVARRSSKKVSTSVVRRSLGKVSTPVATGSGKVSTPVATGSGKVSAPVATGSGKVSAPVTRSILGKVSTPVTRSASSRVFTPQSSPRQGSFRLGSPAAAEDIQIIARQAALKAAERRQSIIARKAAVKSSPVTRRSSGRRSSGNLAKRHLNTPDSSSNAAKQLIATPDESDCKNVNPVRRYHSTREEPSHSGCVMRNNSAKAIGRKSRCTKRRSSEGCELPTDTRRQHSRGDRTSSGKIRRTGSSRKQTSLDDSMESQSDRDRTHSRGASFTQKAKPPQSPTFLRITRHLHVEELSPETCLSSMSSKDVGGKFDSCDKNKIKDMFKTVMGSKNSLQACTQNTDDLKMKATRQIFGQDGLEPPVPLDTKGPKTNSAYHSSHDDLETDIDAYIDEPVLGSEATSNSHGHMLTFGTLNTMV